MCNQSYCWMLFVFKIMVILSATNASAQYVNFSQTMVHLQSPGNVTFICNGTVPLTLQINNKTVATESTTLYYTLSLDSTYNGAVVKCVKNGVSTAVTLDVLFDLETKNNTLYDFVLGKEATAVIEYRANPNLGLVIEDSNGTVMKNMYFIKSGDKGKIYFHFQKIEQKDTGKYTLYINANTQEKKVYKFTIAATLIDPMKLYEILIIIIPCISLLLIVVVIVVAMVCVRKKAKNFVEKPDGVQPKQKNLYVKSGEGKPVPQATTANSTSKTRDEEAPPAVTKRTTSLHHTKLNNISNSAAKDQVQQQDWNNRMSMDSNGSWDDDEDEYVNTVTNDMSYVDMHSQPASTAASRSISFGNNRHPTTNDHYPGSKQKYESNRQPQHSKSALVQSDKSKLAVALKPNPKNKSKSFSMNPITKNTKQYINQSAVKTFASNPQEEDVYEEC